MYVNNSQLPNQASPISRYLISDMPTFWFAGGDPNASQAFRKVENCGCHLLSSYALFSCVNACGNGLAT